MMRKKLYVLSAVSGAMLAGLAGTATLAQENAPTDRDGQRPHYGMKHDGKGWKHHHHRFHHGRSMEGRGMHGGMFGLFGGRHIEGKLAFAKTELGITEAQEPQWNALADAVRSGAERMKALRDEARAERKAAAEASEGRPSRPDLTERLDRMEKQAEARLQTLKEVNAALKPLYASLSDEQKQSVQELIGRRHHARR